MAAQSSARLILSRLTGDNHAAFSSLLAEADVDAALILGKVTGGEGHGGGAVVPAGSALYVSLERYLELLEDKAPQVEEGRRILGRPLRQSCRRTPFDAPHCCFLGG